MESLNQPANQLTIGPAGGTYTPVRGTGLEVNRDESLFVVVFLVLFLMIDLNHNPPYLQHF